MVQALNLDGSLGRNSVISNPTRLPRAGSCTGGGGKFAGGSRWSAEFHMVKGRIDLERVEREPRDKLQLGADTMRGERKKIDSEKETEREAA